MKNLITAADVKTYTVATLNVEAHKFDINIADATDAHLLPLLGAKLVIALLGLTRNAPDAPTATVGAASVLAEAEANYQGQLTTWREANAGPLLDLWDALKPCLAQWTLVEAWPSLLVHVENAGVLLRTGRGEGVSNADAKTLSEVFAAHRSTAVARGEKLVRFLESNKAQYPAYVSTRPVATGRRPSDSFGGINC